MEQMAIETDFAKEFENFKKRCLELEEKSKRYEMRCLMLETEVDNLKKKNEELEGKIATIQKVVVDSTYVENDSNVLEELMIENKVLECEKRKAETEVCFWKEKVKELEKVKHKRLEQRESQVRKRLPFEEDGCSNKRMAPFTPGVAQSLFHGVIDISDEDESNNETPKVKSQRSSEKRTEKTDLEHDEEHTDEFRVHLLNTRSAKRKRAANIVTSDDESSCYDDNAPICNLKTQHTSRVRADSEEEVTGNVNRRYLTRLRKSESKNKTVGSSEDVEDNVVVDVLESEGESLGGFIVDSSLEKIGDTDSTDGFGSENALNEYKASLEKIGRKKIPNLKWDLEGDMLSDFGKDLGLCMSAVWALYRKQTADEKASKETLHQNKEGFNQADAPKASKLAEFLTDGDSNGDLNKTVEELKGYDPDGVELCKTLAARYSKQLFKIYQNKEDPYFPPQR